MAKGGVTKEELNKMDDKINATIKENKKMADSAINTIINHLSKLEKEVETLNKEKEEWVKEKETMKEAQEGWTKEKEEMQEQMAKEDAHKGEALLVHTTIEEEKMRHARCLNVRVTGIEEGKDSTPEPHGKALCTKLGYKIEDPTPLTKAWRVGKDPTKKRSLILQFPSEEAHTLFIRKRVILRSLTGAPIYLDDDLTRISLHHTFSFSALFLFIGILR
ncbi:hypothetical protein L7F22_037998 [Adiantum nelumboides]|nr:hypothetical protein [Adiantum nelumboides]